MCSLKKICVDPTDKGCKNKMTVVPPVAVPIHLKSDAEHQITKGIEDNSKIIFVEPTCK